MTQPAPIHTQMTAYEWLLIAVLSVIWGGTFFFAEVALVELTPLTIVFGRVGLAAVFLHVVVRVAGISMPWHWKTWGAFFVLGLLNNFIPFSLIIWGQIHLSGGVASIFNATTPFFAVFIAHFLTRDERLSTRRVAGIVMGIAGVGCMVGPEAFSGMSGTLLAQLAIMTAAISYSFASIYGRRFSSLSPLVITTGQVTASAILMAPVALYLDRPWLLPPLSPATWGAMAGIAVLCTALAYLLYFRILRTAGATNLMIVTLLIPPSAIVLGVLFLGETLRLQEFLGMAIIGGGLLVLDGRIVKRLRRS